MKKIIISLIITIFIQPGFSKTVFKNSIGQKFVLIKSGTFVMGIGDERTDENTKKHKVRITKNYFIQITEVTQRQWYSIMKTKPWTIDERNKTGPDYPVSNVSWRDVKKFIRKLKRKENTSRYRLPSEAEWEYACRAGSKTKYCFGDDESKLGQYAWFYENTIEIDKNYAHKVKQKKPNKWGLYDMHGNMRELCEDRVDFYLGIGMREIFLDCKGEIIVVNGIKIDPVCKRGKYAITKGGSWIFGANHCLSGGRYNIGFKSRSNVIGFRLAMDVKETIEDDHFK